MAKASSETNTSSEQVNYLKERVKSLETDLEKQIRERTDQQYEIRRL